METLRRIKITEIPETRYRYRQFRDANGQYQQGSEQYTAYREVQVVDGWARFGHYMIDTVILWVVQQIIGFLFGFTAGMAGAVSSPDDLLVLQLEAAGVGMVVSFGYFFIFEAMYASTPGKMMLGRIVIDEYALKPEPGKIAIRSISRMVPFEAFSCLAPRGWHDKWSKTFVVDKKEAELLWNLLNQAEMNQTFQNAESYRNQQGPDIQ